MGQLCHQPLPVRRLQPLVPRRLLRSHDWKDEENLRPSRQVLRLQVLRLQGNRRQRRQGDDGSDGGEEQFSREVFIFSHLNLRFSVAIYHSC